MPADDKKLEADLERELEIAVAEKKDSPDLTVAKDLIPRSKSSFTGHIKQLDEKIAAVNREIVTARTMRDQAIERVDEEWKKRLHECERDLYQIKTLRAAIELAVAALGE